MKLIIIINIKAYYNLNKWNGDIFINPKGFRCGRRRNINYWKTNNNYFNPKGSTCYKKNKYGIENQNLEYEILIGFILKDQRIWLIIYMERKYLYISFPYK